MRIALFVTCLADTLFPAVPQATVTLLERLGHEVVFPAGQTCCGQMHVNTGYQADALPVVWLSKLISLPLLALYLVLLPSPLDGGSLAWGALAGTFGAVGVVVFYRALSAGAMTVVAPIT